MRIRKNAKLSAILYTTNASLTNESSSSCLIQSNNLNICQLNQSPWDIITFSSSSSTSSSSSSTSSSTPSSSSFHLQLDDYLVNYNVNIAENRRWFDSTSDFKSAALNTSGFGETDNVNGRDDGLGENANLSCRKNDCGETLGVKKGDASEIQEEIKLEGDTCDGLEEIKLCGETDEEGWQCGSVVQNGCTMCEYHLSELESYAVWNAKKKFGAASGSRPTSGCRPRRAKKRPNTNPHDFYYYSGFGPSWGKKRGIMGTDLSGIDGDVDVKEQKGKRFEPVKSEVRPVELDYMDDDDDYSDDDEIEILGRKKERKPVKERSLKSLM